MSGQYPIIWPITTGRVCSPNSLLLFGRADILAVFCGHVIDSPFKLVCVL